MISRLSAILVRTSMCFPVEFFILFQLALRWLTIGADPLDRWIVGALQLTDKVAVILGNADLLFHRSRRFTLFCERFCAPFSIPSPNRRTSENDLLAAEVGAFVIEDIV